MKKVKRGGITYGRSHKEGGIPVKNQSTGEMLEVEGGEGIVNKRSMASDKMVTFNGKKMTICEAVSALNQMEGGVEFSCDDVAHKQFIEEMELGGELERGVRTEKEHIETLRKLYEKRITPTQATKEVAKEHLKEDPKYYSKLAKMESKMKKGGQAKDNPFASMGLKKDFVGSWEDKIDYFLKKSDNFCDVEKKYCASTIDIDRADMPQIYEEYIPQYMDFLEQQGIDSRYEHGVQVGELRPTQKNISLPRMKRMLQRLLNGYYTDSEGKMLNPLKRVVIATKDGYLLDGHHRWASSLFLSPKNTVDVLRVEANIKDLVPISKNFGMVEFQKFMFGGKINADINLPRVSGFGDPQDAKKQTSLIVKRGGFPSKGIRVMPTYTEVTDAQGQTSKGYANRGITFNIGNVNLRYNSTYDVANDLSAKLQAKLPNLRVDTRSGGRYGNTYEVLPVPASIIKKADEPTFFGVLIYIRKFGKTMELTILPSQNQLDLLEDGSFLDDVMDALNEITKYPNTPTTKAKEVDTTVITFPAPTPTHYEPNRKYRFKTEKEMEFEFGKKWRDRFKYMDELSGYQDSITNKRYNFVWGKPIKMNQYLWRGFFQNRYIQPPIYKLGIEIEGKIAADKLYGVKFCALQITYDGYEIEPTIFNSRKRYRFLTLEECVDQGLVWQDIASESIFYGVSGKKADNIKEKISPNMLFGREIPKAVYEWYKYLESNNLKWEDDPSQGLLGSSWDLQKVLNLDFSPRINPVDVFLNLRDIYDENGYKDSFEKNGEKFNVPQELKNLFRFLVKVKGVQGYVESELYSSYMSLDSLTAVDGRARGWDYTLITNLMNLGSGTNLMYDVGVADIFPSYQSLSFAYKMSSPYIKEFTYEQETLEQTPQIFSLEDIYYDPNEGKARRNADYKTEAFKKANATYFALDTQLSINQADFFYGQSVPREIYEGLRYAALYMLKPRLGYAGTITPLNAWAMLPFVYTNVAAQAPIEFTLSLFEVVVGAGENGEDLYKWNIPDNLLTDASVINGTYAPKELYKMMEFISHGNPNWAISESVDLADWGNGLDKIVKSLNLRGAWEDDCSGVFLKNNWVQKGTNVSEYKFNRSTNEIDKQIEAIQSLMDSFASDETQVKQYLLKEISNLRSQRERELLKRYYDPNLKNLLALYASKVSEEQRTATPNNGCGLATPSGEPSELDLIQYKIVRTKEFKNWFGDWELAYQTKNYNGVSKAINPKTGEPILLYHGKGNMQVEATKFGFGVFPMKYFGANFTYAEWFANNYPDIRVIYEFFVSVKNPMDFSKVGLENISGDMFKALVASIYGYEIQTPIISPPNTELRMWQILRGNPRVLSEIRDNTDYDGFIFYEDNPSDILPNGEMNSTLAFGTFENEQSKAADGRNTTFFLEAEDFRFRKGGIIKKHS